MKQLCLLSFLLLLLFPGFAQQRSSSTANKNTAIEPGAYQLNQYLPLLKNKRVGIFANPTSMVGHRHLVDTLQRLGIRITKIFGPEHGFRGEADAGAKVDSYVDAATGVPVVSLYGKKTVPDANDLADVDVMVFDLQDVGVRFYTYISSLQDYMEGAIAAHKPLIVLDRPNPNGFYVDGPVLDTAFKSHVGMQPIPIVYGMTIGEYARMLLGEQWLKVLPAAGEHWSLKIIRCRNYTHKSHYALPVKPSPNLPDMASIYLYPSTCFFEGTVLSEGRGTDHPFAVFGHPSLPNTLYRFTPTSRPGAVASKNYNKVNYGWNLYGSPQQVLQEVNNQIQLKWLIEAYRLFPQKDSFFIRPKTGTYFFNKLAGNNILMQQLVQNKTAAEIKASWQPGLTAFRKIRKKYLLYQDFE
ncbi:exo-beta-N-acetylmuramidase NamZ family protein [Deminuibacter soli]|uniref:DUF1343 domain-containing protein n=1 Tax=Deminuibacter soli TaxID=2291815 RepID=A0A3E1NLL1_9BACT|nr:DUF1343 domain-containing protein [Deminuibacter soli]RFM28803.1 DUF1343 domain-containing protein [Deminuibacter soli]